jgi:PAS domain S-box-containing protein
MATRPTETAPTDPVEVERLLHELRVHQIELEMQNEELRRVQAELEASRARYFELYDLAPVGYVTLSEKGLILEANLAIAVLLGVTRATLVRESLSSYVLRADQEIYYRHRQALRAADAPQVCELRLLRADGAPVWVLIDATVAPGSDGAPVCRAALIDISARKQAAEALRQSQEQFRTAQEFSPDGFTILRPVRDAQGQLVDFTWVYENGAVARMNGTEPLAVVGRSLLELFPGHRGSPFLRAYQKVAESGESSVFEAEYAGDSLPAPTWFRTAVVPMGQDIAVLAQDITATKRAEEALRASRQQLRALASRVQTTAEEERASLARNLHDGLAQDLTRLKIDLLMLQTQMCKSRDVTVRGALALSVGKMAKIADGAILSVQHIATGLRPAVLDSLGLCAAVEWLARDFQDHAKVTCLTNVPAADLPAERDVATAAFRILQEALTNVQRHAHASRVEVLLRQEAGELVLRIADDGCGIRAEKRDSLLSIGLAGMRERALLLGGQCDIRSQPGAGTTIDVRMPLVPSAVPLETMP